MGSCQIETQYGKTKGEGERGGGERGRERGERGEGKLGEGERGGVWTDQAMWDLARSRLTTV